MYQFQIHKDNGSNFFIVIAGVKAKIEIEDFVKILESEKKWMLDIKEDGYWYRWRELSEECI